MKIILVSTNRQQCLFRPPPVGLAYLAPPLIRDKHEVKILDLMIPENPKAVFENVLASFDPHLVGFSIRNLDNQNMLNPDQPVVDAKKYVDLAKAKGKITVLGGTGFSILPEEMMEYMGADYGICGQGESGLPKLVHMIESKKTVKDISGLVQRRNGTVQSNGKVVDGFNGLRADWSLLNIAPYKNFLFPVSILIKSGCPFKCSYCDTPHIAGNKFRFREPEDIIYEIRSIIEKFNNRVFYFADSCFNFPMEKTKELLAAIIKAKLNIQFYANMVPIRGSYDDEYFKLYKMAGGGATGLGGDTLSDVMLNNYHKPFNFDDIMRCNHMLRKNKMKFVFSLLIGGVGENEDSVKESMTKLAKINFSRCAYSFGVRILPRTAIFEKAIEEGIIKNRKDLLFPKFYFSKDLDLKWAEAYVKKQTKKYKYRNIRLLSFQFKNYYMRKF